MLERVWSGRIRRRSRTGGGDLTLVPQPLYDPENAFPDMLWESPSKRLTAGNLRALLEGVDDDLPVIVALQTREGTTAVNTYFVSRESLPEWGEPRLCLGGRMVQLPVPSVGPSGIVDATYRVVNAS